MIWTQTELSTTEAALRAGVSRMTIVRWIAAGKLSARRVGRAYIINADDLRLLVASGDQSQTESLPGSGELSDGPSSLPLS